jgi:glycosyltransferase involved in cell wall biosynthesis
LRGEDDFDFPGTAALDNLAGPDGILHLHNPHGGYFDLRQVPGLSQRHPFVVTAHDQWLSTGHCAYSLTCEKWRTDCDHCPWPRNPPPTTGNHAANNWARKQAILSASRLHLICPSRWLQRVLENSLLAPALLSSTHIPNGVDQQIFYPLPPLPEEKAALRARLNLPPDALILAFTVAAQGNPYKDTPTLLSAVRSLMNEQLSPDQPLHLLALGHRGILPGTEAPPPGHITATGYLSEARNLADYLRAADLFLHSSQADNHPLAILEAQCCGLPVIATDVGGVPETLDAGHTGLLVPPGDSSLLAAAAATLLADRNLRVTMGRNAAAYGRTHFSLSAMLDAYEEVYRTALVAQKPVGGARLGGAGL